MPAGGTTELSGAVAEIVMSSVAVVAREPRVQRTARVPWFTAQDQLGPLAAIALNPLGKVSATETVLAASGPLLRGCRVKVAAAPAIIGVGEALLVIRRSAPAETLTVAVAVLFPGTPS